MLKRIAFILIALQFLTIVQPRQRRFELAIYNLTCTILTDRMKRFDCNFRKLSENHFIINQYFMFSRNLGKEFQARLWVQVLMQNSNKPMNFLDVKLKVCEYLSKPLEGQLLRVILNEMKRSSNIPRSCPFKGNFLYRVNNVSVTDEFFPPYTPFVNFTYTFEFYENNVLFAASKLVGATMPYKKIMGGKKEEAQ